jgi:2-dehydro-3-deoxyphosphogluconate aldolase/(4S)-4-hydroxy-2-oxoglutarate aldolase
MKQNNIRAVLSKHPAIPVVTFHEISEVVPQLEKLTANGIQCIEITLRTAVSFEAIAEAKKTFGDRMDIGVGTLVSVAQIEKATSLGVNFMVSPGIHPTLAPALESSGIAFIPGVATPSEIISGLQLGWDTFKFFPAQLFGGLDALKTYGQVFPEVRFCPTGGIKADTFERYLELPNVLSVGGSWMQ